MKNDIIWIIVTIMCFLLGFYGSELIKNYYKTQEFYKERFEINEKNSLLKDIKIDSLKNELQKCK